MKKKTTKKTIEEINICDDCKFSQIYDNNPLNRDIYGKPTLLTCKFEEFRIVRGSRACRKFEKR